MRKAIGVTVVALVGCSLHALGCAGGTETQEVSGSGTSSTTTATTTGSGGGGGEGGGGVPCTEEVCDGVDNDCDDEVDEGCECLAGDTRTCYTGPEGTKDVGACKAGTQACNPATNTFGACSGERGPTEESCNGADDDCDGEVDEDIPDLECGIGACAATVAGCDNGQPGQCVPGQPIGEVCDGVDNDCDQLVDEDFPESGDVCASGIPGICSPGTMQCLTGELTCVPNKLPGGELCDGQDNDCNGVTDDGVPGTGGDCSTGYPGVCAPGTISCQNAIIDCYPVVPPSPELCDGLDNDCDGLTDEGNPEGGAACDSGQLGLCQAGTVQCIGAALVCTPNALAGQETCDGLDNNCDGQVDEGNPGSGATCTCGGSTACNAGLLKCQGCTKEVTCNDGLDDESDGATDCADSECTMVCGLPPCGPGEKLMQINYSGAAVSIVDNTTVSAAVTVSEDLPVKRVMLQLNITHTWDSDLDISLRAPGQASDLDVSSDNGGSADNYTSTIFSDTCANPVALGSAPFNGCYTPETPFSTLNGISSKGTWTLKIGDDASGDTGSLTVYRLGLCVGP
jgi:subtilisin-like proprotein convertase family protein